MTPSPNHTQAVKTALLRREAVNQAEAIRRGWGLCLSAIVHRLRARGWPILTTQDHNNGLARYRLAEGWPPPETQKPL